MRFSISISFSLFLLFIPGVFAVAPSAAVAPATPTFRWGGGTNPNMVSSATNLPDAINPDRPLWEVKVGTHQYTIPTLDRGRIFVAANDAAVTRTDYKRTLGGALYCLDQSSGNLIWQLPVPRYMPGIIPPYHFDQWRCGICSGPVVDGDRVYIIGNRGEVLCLDREGQANGNAGPFRDELADMNLPTTATLVPTDGDIIWKYDLKSELGAILHDVCGSTLLLDGGLLYVCTSNGIDDKHKLIPRPLVPTLIVLDAQTGRLVAADAEKIGERMLHCNWSSPLAAVVGGRKLIFFGGGDGLLYAFEPVRPAAPGAPVQTLKKVWSLDCNPAEYRYHDGKLLPHSTSAKKLTDGPSEIIGTAVVYENKIYVVIGQSSEHGPGQGCLTCADAATGALLWRSTLVDRSLATPAIAGGLLYIPDYSGKLHCFDAATGRRCWVHDMEGRDWHCSAFVADGKVYVGTENCNFWILKAGREKQVISRSKLKSPPVTPVAADGVLFIPTQFTLSAYAK